MARPKERTPRNKAISIRFTEEEYLKLRATFEAQKEYGFKLFNPFLRNKLFLKNDELLKGLKSRKSEKQQIFDQHLIFQLKRAGVNLNNIMKFVYKEKTTTKLSFKHLIAIDDIILEFRSIIKKLEHDS